MDKNGNGIREEIFLTCWGPGIWMTLVSFDVISINVYILKLAITHIFQIFKNSISRKSGITHYNDNQQRSISLGCYSTSYTTTMSKHFHLRILYSKLCVFMYVYVQVKKRRKKITNSIKIMK